MIVDGAEANGRRKQRDNICFVVKILAEQELFRPDDAAGTPNEARMVVHGMVMATVPELRPNNDTSGAQVQAMFRYDDFRALPFLLLCYNICAGGCMIRPFCDDDTEAVVRVWLEASVEAHRFIPRSFWEAAAGDMRTLYLPLSDEIVLHVDDGSGNIDAFLAFTDSFLAALFVTPAAQGQGLGSRLFRIARRMHPDLSLCVYKENERAVAFYRRHGLVVLGERVEEKTGHVELLMGIAPDSSGQDGGRAAQGHPSEGHAGRPER